MNQNFLKLSFVVSLGAVLGSLYFSEILKFPPCSLCWYQRIFFYPLAVIFATAIWTGDRNYRKYAWPLIVIGLSIALYHNMIYYGWIAQELTPCTGDVPCSAKQLELFGFITIPMLSMMGFLSLALLMFFDRGKK